MEKLYEWVRQIAYVMVLISAACGWKTVPEVYQAVHGNRSDSFYACSGVSDIWNRYDRIHD